MSVIEKSIEVNVPVRTAYNQWTQFEDFPKFMEGVRQVTQLDDTRLQWKANIAGKDEEWNAEITEQIPDQRIAWKSQGGASNAGAVTFQSLSDAKSKIMLHLEYEPRGQSKKWAMPRAWSLSVSRGPQAVQRLHRNARSGDGCLEGDH